jgi:hypothetical protein
MKTTILIIILFIINSPCFSQGSDSCKYSLKGKIYAIYRTTKIPVKGSQVFLISLITGKSVSPGVIESDEDGEFHFEELKSGEYQLYINSEYGKIDTLIKVDINHYSEIKISLILQCEVNEETAIQDIKNGKPKLLIYEGQVRFENSNQHLYEKKFGVEYYFLKKYNAPPKECVSEYNQVIFKHLSTKFGNEWKKEIRKDVVGIEK